MIGARHTVTRTGIVIGGRHVRTAPWWACEAITGPHARQRRSAAPWVLALVCAALVAASAVFAGGASESEVAQLVHQQVRAVAQEIK